MKIKRSAPRYRWRRTWSGKVGDFTADDGGRRFARLVHKADGRPNEAWAWSLAAFKDANRHCYGLGGVAETARLAVRHAEDAYDGAS